MIHPEAFADGARIASGRGLAPASVEEGRDRDVRHATTASWR
jgi:hypothetical protein